MDVVRAGTRVPPAVLSAHWGEELSLADIAAERACLIVFYPFAFSPVCSREMSELAQLAGEFAAADCQIVTVSCDSKYVLSAWAGELDLPFTLLSDFWPHGALARAFDVFDEQSGMAVRGTFLAARGGVVTAAEVCQAGQQRSFAPWLARSQELTSSTSSSANEHGG